MPNLKPAVKMTCPFPNNYDCICRQGAVCGGYVGFRNEPSHNCQYYKPLTMEELLKIETKLMNECDGCPEHHRCYGSNNDKNCGITKSIDVIRKLQRRMAHHRRDDKNHKSISGVTFAGKENK